MTKYLTMKVRGDFGSDHTYQPLLDVTNLQRWITFYYLNHNFGIHYGYLKNKLHITSGIYSKIALRKIASSKELPTNEFINTTSKSTENYLSSHNSS